jgi:hypothetical protein
MQRLLHQLMVEEGHRQAPQAARSLSSIPRVQILGQQLQLASQKQMQKFDQRWRFAAAGSVNGTCEIR